MKFLNKSNAGEEVRKEVKNMSRFRTSKKIAMSLATNIIDGIGDLKFKDVPPRYKTLVKECLVELGAENLAVE